MIKVSETRSALRRIVLTKAAASYGSELDEINNAIAGHYGAAASRAGAGLGEFGKAVGGTYSGAYNVQNGVNTQSATYKTNSGQQTNSVQQAQQDAWRKAQDADVARIRAALVGRVKSVARPVVNAVKPVVGAVSSIFKR